MKSFNNSQLLKTSLWLVAGVAATLLHAQTRNLGAGRQRVRLQQESLHTTTYKDRGGYFQIHLVDLSKGTDAGYEIVLEGPVTGTLTIAKADARGLVWETQAQTPTFWSQFARANGLSRSIQAVTGEDAGAVVAELRVVGNTTHRLRFSGLATAVPGTAGTGSWLDVQIEENEAAAGRSRLYSQRTDLAQLASRLGANRTLVDLERNMVSNYFQVTSR